MIATMKSLLHFTALSATICTAAYAADASTAVDTSALDALEAKIDALQAEVTTLKNKANKVDTSPLLRRRELWTSWQEVHDELQDKLRRLPRGLYIGENLDTGDAVTVYEAGPIKVQVGCGQPTCDSTSEVCLILTISNTGEDDILAFGSTEGDENFSATVSPGDTFLTELWDVSSVGNDGGEGAVWVDGHYLGYVGDSFIGIRSSSELEVIGGNCQVAGVLDYFIPFHKDD